MYYDCLTVIPFRSKRNWCGSATYISEFDIKLVHIPGVKNALADVLSRQSDLCPEDDDNKDVNMLPEHLFVKLIDQGLHQVGSQWRHPDK